MKKAKPNEKPLDGIKWLNKVSVDATVNQNEAIPKWLDSCVYKHKRTSASSSENSCEIFDDIGVSLVTENCNLYLKENILTGV